MLDDKTAPNMVVLKPRPNSDGLGQNGFERYSALLYIGTKFYVVYQHVR